MKPRKDKPLFRCQSCGYDAPQWLGRCPGCNAWNTMAEEARGPVSAGRPMTPFTSAVTPLAEVSAEAVKRIHTGIGEFDRILGGGVVPGSLVLLGGPPGIGKSTLMLQVAGRLAADRPVLYVSGEESLAQVKSRADRLGVAAKSLFLLSETNLESVIEALEKVKPRVLVIDSIQTAYRPDFSSAPGSVGQIRECAAELLRVAKTSDLTVFLLGHVTKEGDIAGPRVLEHIVDTVLYFESEREQVYRVLRAHKNRFGATSEVGVFEMTAVGLTGVDNPSELFLSERSAGVPGSVVASTVEGTRPLLLEVQSLVSRTGFGFPKRMVTGYDAGRVGLLIAVLEKKLGMPLDTQDVFVNIVGGMKIRETGLDLAVACAIASGHAGFVCPPRILVLGEVGLAGEVRSIGQLAERCVEAEKLGFERALVPAGNVRKYRYPGRLVLTGVETVEAAVAALRE